MRRDRKRTCSDRGKDSAPARFRQQDAAEDASNLQQQIPNPNAIAPFGIEQIRGGRHMGPYGRGGERGRGGEERQEDALLEIVKHQTLIIQQLVSELRREEREEERGERDRDRDRD